MVLHFVVSPIFAIAIMLVAASSWIAIFVYGVMAIRRIAAIGVFAATIGVGLLFGLLPIFAAVLALFVVAMILTIGTFLAWSFAASSAERAVRQMDPDYAARLFVSAEEQFVWRALPVRTSVLFDGTGSPEVARQLGPLQRLTRAVEMSLGLAIALGAVLLLSR